jgi:hypothetical protein
MIAEKRKLFVSFLVSIWEQLSAKDWIANHARLMQVSNGSRTVLYVDTCQSVIG